MAVEKALQQGVFPLQTGIPENLSFGPIPYFPYLSTAGALFAITGSSQYEQAVQKYFDHPREQVRWWAEHALGIEVPTTAKRNAEYEKKPENR